MTIAEAQREFRAVYLGGFSYMLVESILWLATAIVASLGHLRGSRKTIFLVAETRVGLEFIKR
jgi:hypothetical protein